MNPEFSPTPDQRFSVIVKSACGFTHKQIAAELNIDPKTLRKAFRQDLKQGKEYANSTIKQSLFKKAIGNGPQSVGAAIFWLKTQCGWKETSKFEHAGANGAPLVPPNIGITFDDGGPGSGAPQEETATNAVVETSP